MSGSPHRAGISRRRAVGLFGVVPLIGMTACSGSSVMPAGWDRAVVSGAYVPVRSDWQHMAAPGGIGLFSDMWQEAASPSHVLAVGSPSAGLDLQGMLAETEDALRSSLPGFRVTSQQAAAERSGGQLLYEDFTTTFTGATSGRIWLLTNEKSAIAVVLMAENLDESYRDVVDAELSLQSSDLPAVDSGWTRVGRGTTSFAVPGTWAVTGAPTKSERWTDSWADADMDGAARARVLLAPDTGEPGVVDALAQIESDAVAGALSRYVRLSEPVELELDGQENASGIRVYFAYGNGRAAQGALWVLGIAGTVSAIQLSFSGPADQGIVSRMERSIWLTAPDQ
ncbi:hypothetical protein SAMN05216355_101622 [Actinomyces ruminicola]|uniref:Uncharacterized protein n=1 Tax=Actinomyces ruminicola TaxID=332524 RepID=A0A1H0A8A4_9ACTO|nr:hypothetical protein [Actinomyces ruminicola]SDN29647.1 hypothetical protein SAMN05216355_101622 [Actinomyces ruminicola]